MRYTVYWEQQALDAVASIWLQASDRQVVTRASNRIDPELAVDADSKGVDFYGDRLLVIAPLHVTYRVDVAGKQVRVLNVWRV